MLLHIWMKVGSKLLDEEFQIKFHFHHGRTTSLWVIALCPSHLIQSKHLILVAKRNFLGSVGDLYCFSNTLSMLISPPPVKPEGTIGLHSVCQSVCLSVSLSVCLSVRHTSFRTITDYVIHLWSWNFIHLLPMSQGCALLILGSKGQRSRSWIIDVWKWFPDHNWFCNPPMIMKLHTLAPHESRMCPIDFGVKRSKVKVMAHGYLKMVSGR